VNLFFCFCFPINRHVWSWSARRRSLAAADAEQQPAHVGDGTPRRPSPRQLLAGARGPGGRASPPTRWIKPPPLPGVHPTGRAPRGHAGTPGEDGAADCRAYRGSAHRQRGGGGGRRRDRGELQKQIRKSFLILFFKMFKHGENHIFQAKSVDHGMPNVSA
jgi:hypothetical protein